MHDVGDVTRPNDPLLVLGRGMTLTHMDRRTSYSPPVIRSIGSVARLTMSNKKSDANDDQNCSPNANNGSNNPCTVP